MHFFSALHGAGLLKGWYMNEAYSAFFFIVKLMNIPVAAAT